MEPPPSRLVTWRAACLLLTAFFAFVSSGSIQGQVQTRVGERSADGVWQVVADRPAALPPRTDITGTVATVFLNKEAFDAHLVGAPRDDEPNPRPGVEMTLPMPDGTFARFHVVESPIVVPELVAAFPQIRTYRAQGIDDPTATARFGWTDLGFHSIVLSASGTAYVDPYSKGNTDYYIAYGKQDRRRDGQPSIGEDSVPSEDVERGTNEFPISHGESLRTYRLALAATGEYTAAAGGTKVAGLGRMIATMNRVNGIFEREVAVRMTLSTGPAADPTGLIYLNGATDPYSNDDRQALTQQNQSHLDTVIGTANYDVGHVFAASGGGWAYFGVCNPNFKASASSGLVVPGDLFDVDMVSHEIGHQFGADHTFNGLSGICGANQRAPLSAFEVGSGSTIMSYAGECNDENLQREAHDYFHVETVNRITAWVTSGVGASCGVVSASGNAPPTVTGPGNFTIPRNTPFALTATAADTNGDALTYSWEEFDLGAASTSAATASTDDGSRPLFRAYAPTPSPTRTFPSLQFILNNANVPPQTFPCSAGTCLTGEVLPSLSRTMRFQVTARDNHAGGGGIATALSTVTIESTAGPFRVTSPNAAVSFVGGSTQTITWDTNGSNVSPVNATTVKISLSTDGGLTFPTVVLASTPNDGSESLAIPNSVTTTARIKVEAVGNIFFDVSDTNFAITPGVEPPPPPPPGVGAPTNFAASSIVGNTVTFTWTPGTGTLPITNYLIEGGVTPGGVLGSLPIPTGSSFSTVLPTGAFYIRLYALSSATRSGVSNEIRIFVNVPALPSAPTNLLGLVNGSSLGLSWVNTTGGGPPAGIMLDVTGTLSGRVPLPVTETFVVGGVPPGTYTFSVRATNATGTSAGSPPVTLTFPGACSGAPLMPLNVVMSKAGTMLSLSWLPPASGPAATGYALVVSGAFNGMVPVGAVRALSGSVPPGSYTIKVAATNACGTGPATAPQTVVVP